jgi:hypothetical protein
MKRQARPKISVTPCFSAVSDVSYSESRLKGFSSQYAQRTWLKPGVNEILGGE